VQLGNVIRTYVTDTNPPKIKLFIIIGSDSENVATIFINTNIRISDFPEQLQGLQLPVDTQSCPFLSHNSFIDCSDIKLKPKSKLNAVLQKEPSRLIGQIPAGQMEIIKSIIRRAKSITTEFKKQYGLWY